LIVVKRFVSSNFNFFNHNFNANDLISSSGANFRQGFAPLAPDFATALTQTQPKTKWSFRRAPHVL